MRTFPPRRAEWRFDRRGHRRLACYRWNLGLPRTRPTGLFAMPASGITFASTARSPAERYTAVNMTIALPGSAEPEAAAEACRPEKGREETRSR